MLFLSGGNKNFILFLFCVSRSIMPCAGCDVNEVIVFLSNPIPKNPLSGSAKKIQILIWICRLSTSLIRLPLFYCLFKSRLAPNIIVMRAAPAAHAACKIKICTSSKVDVEAACNKFHACAKESYYIAQRVPQDLTKSERRVACLAFKIFTFFLLPRL